MKVLPKFLVFSGYAHLEPVVYNQGQNHNAVDERVSLQCNYDKKLDYWEKHRPLACTLRLPSTHKLVYYNALGTLVI